MVIFAISYKEIFPKRIYSVIYHMKTSGSHSRGKYSSAIRISPIIYLMISIGVSLQIGGSNWDIVWHGVGNVETFFTPPHSVIYSGVALAIGSVIGGIIQARFHNTTTKERCHVVRTISFILTFIAKTSCNRLYITAQCWSF